MTASPWQTVTLARDELLAGMEAPEAMPMADIIDGVASVRLALDSLPGTAGVETLSGFMGALVDALTRHRGRPTTATPDLGPALAQLHTSDHDDLDRVDPPELLLIVEALRLAGEAIQDPGIRAFLVDVAGQLRAVHNDVACIRADLADVVERLGDFAGDDDDKLDVNAAHEALAEPGVNVPYADVRRDLGLE